MPSYRTKYICPECGSNINEIYRTNHWTITATPLLVCSNPKCKFEIHPHTRKEQELFDKLISLKKKED